MTKPGLARPIVIPKKKDLAEDIVLSVARTLGLTRKQVEQKLVRKPKRALRAASLSVEKAKADHPSRPATHPSPAGESPTES